MVDITATEEAVNCRSSGAPALAVVSSSAITKGPSDESPRQGPLASSQHGQGRPRSCNRPASRINGSPNGAFDDGVKRGRTRGAMDQ